MTSVLCRHCHEKFDVKQILGISGDANQLREAQKSQQTDEGARLPLGTVESLSELVEDGVVRIVPWSTVRLPPNKNRPLERLIRGGTRKEADIADLVATSWDPYCPRLHLMIDALSERPFFITVAGEVGASKSTFLLGMVAEMLQTARLGPLDEVVPTVRPSQLDEVRKQIHSVYVENKVLPATRADEIKDGFVVKLAAEDLSEPLNVGFVDVSGEVIRDEAKSAKHARFIYSSDGVILLLDPRAFPRKDAFMLSKTEGVDVVSADIINSLASGILKVRGRGPAELNIPLVIAVSKSDLVAEWAAEFTSRISDSAAFAELADESELVRNYFLENDMAAIVRTAEVKFGKDNVSYTRLSALGEDSTTKAKARRSPAGCWKPVALLLNRVGYLDESRDA